MVNADMSLTVEIHRVTQYTPHNKEYIHIIVASTYTFEVLFINTASISGVADHHSIGTKTLMTPCLS